MSTERCNRLLLLLIIKFVPSGSHCSISRVLVLEDNTVMNEAIFTRDGLPFICEVGRAHSSLIDYFL